MISKISIQNFKSLRDITLDCGMLNLFSGLNGMGKSSVIQALLLLRQSHEKGYLKDNGLTLKGDLTNIGVGRDALFQGSLREEIRFSISYDMQTYDWMFGYRQGNDKEEYNFQNSDVLPYSEDVAKPEISDFFSLFSDKKFRYLNADRWVKNQYERSDFHVRNRNLGIHGEYAVQFLLDYGSKKDEEVHASLLYPNTTLARLDFQVSQWMNEISPDTIVKAEQIQNVDVVKLRYQVKTPEGLSEDILPTNVGFGMTYVLPVIIALLSSKPGDILIIENPESHLHPHGQSMIGNLIARVAKIGVQLFVESHSDHILNGIRVAVKMGVPAELIRFFFFRKMDYIESSESIVDFPKLDQDGRINKWPTNFFDEWDNNLIQLL